MITGSLTFLLDKNNNYNTEFRLFPKTERAPLFIGRPVDKFLQFRWLSEYGGPTDYKFKEIRQRTNTIGMLEGTPFRINLKAYDPTNLYSIIDDSKITYHWKRDGSMLFEFNNLNDLRGTGILEITSESCTRDISGVYELDATNQYGTTTSDPIVIDVINRKYHPYLYKNLIANGCGEQGAADWTSDGDIMIRNFSTHNRQNWSIPHNVYQVTYFGPYEEEFEFSSYGNETRLSQWFNRSKNPSNFSDGYSKWIIKSFPPTLVATDGDPGGQDSWFFPSWNYIDSYNKNNNLYKLGDIITKTKTYITRDKIKFAIYGGKAKSTTYQDIQIGDISGMVDGEYYGIDKLVAHFFAYVGVGISNYKLEFVDASTGAIVEDNPIPQTMYKYKVSSISGRPSFIPLHPSGSTLNTFAAASYDISKRDKYSRKIKPATNIVLTPVCYDKTDIRLDFINENDNIISSDIIYGPQERDIWAVKEKFFVPYHIGNLYSWATNATNQNFVIYSQSYTSIDAIRGVDEPSYSIKDSHAEWIKKYHYRLFDTKWDMFGPNSTPRTLTNSDADEAARQDAINTYGFDKSFVQKNGSTTVPLWTVEGPTSQKFDRGAAAFFGIQKNVVVPKGTRTIRVNILFSHTSETINDSNPRLKDWRNQDIYYNFFTRDDPGTQLVSYGNPRCAVTATHLSLHPNFVEISDSYNTYEVNLSGSVWFQELAKLENPLGNNTIVPQSFNVNNLQYVPSVSTIPSPPNINNTVIDILYPDLTVLLDQTNPFVLDSGSGTPIFEQQTNAPTASLVITPDNTPPTLDPEEPTSGSLDPFSGSLAPQTGSNDTGSMTTSSG